MLLAKVAPSPRRTVPFDAIGQASAVLALGCVTYALIEGGRYGFTSPAILAASAPAVMSRAWPRGS
jgi:MFS transporter, DHA2 family, methylenomycin A resistance protein